MRREYYAVACKRLDAHDGAHQGYVYYTGAVACECYVCVNISTHARARTHTHTYEHIYIGMHANRHIHTHIHEYIHWHACKRDVAHGLDEDDKTRDE